MERLGGQPRAGAAAACLAGLRVRSPGGDDPTLFIGPVYSRGTPACWWDPCPLSDLAAESDLAELNPPHDGEHLPTPAWIAVLGTLVSEGPSRPHGGRLHSRFRASWPNHPLQGGGYP